MDIKVFGIRGSFPSFGKKYDKYGHDTSCYAISDGDYAIILDCGSGLIGAKDLINNASKIDVFLTHVHYDHIMGLFEMQKCFEGKDVTFYGEFSKWTKDERKESDGQTLCHIEDLVKFKKIEIKHGEEISLSNGYKAVAYHSNHPNHSSMISLKKDGKHFVYTGDYEHTDLFNIGAIVSGCDLLLIDGTYTKEGSSLYKGWGHSSWAAAVEIGNIYNVKQIITTHHASTNDDELLDREEKKAQALFKALRFARQGDEYTI